MKKYKTRMEKRLAEIQAKKKREKQAATLLGTTLVTLPVFGGAIGSQPVEAAEYNYQQPDAAASLISQIGPAASEIAAANDLYASVMIAQALLESGNGGSKLAQAPYYNLFGVKGTYNGQAVYMPTLEFLNGQWVTINEPFRQYGSYYQSIADHAAVLRSTSFYSGTSHYSGSWKSNTSSYQDATAFLTGRYATDPGYAGKLNSLIATYNLTQYDTPSSYTQTAATSTESTQPQEMSYQSESAATTSNESGNTYTVASGDTLWDIANTYGTTVDQLMANNGLTSNLITVGQTLVV